MANILNYQKRRNAELFKRLEEPSTLFLSKTQNYIPIYKRFLSLNETNYNSINLNHQWYISNITGDENECDNIYSCNIKNINTQKVRKKDCFFKMAPLLDPYKFLIGKYNVDDTTLFNLPDLNSNETNTQSKYMDVNNSAYVDGFFLYLNNILLYGHNFSHGLDYYGSFLALKNDFKINVMDDIDCLNNSDFFKRNKNILFKIDDYDHLFQDKDVKLKPIQIEYDSNAQISLSFDSFNDDIDKMFEDVSSNNESSFDLTELDIAKTAIENKTTTLRSNSSCSSRSSHTIDDEHETSVTSNDFTDSEEENDDDNYETDDDDSTDEEVIEAIIPKFPVQVICMEACERTLDDLIMSQELTKDEWFSTLFQIIMILITFQKAFSFTHNDLHTNNVMFNHTDKKFIYYCYKKKYYKVPTFGRMFKIIDFGRSIYKFNGKIFCSDSFQNGNDAATQYNTEPYFNERKPRLEPNFSFDLCRLACSIFDYVIDDLKKIDLNNPVQRIINEWTQDDKGVNLLYKNNGVERYPDFKLYKMIARYVHNHTPQEQLERKEFKVFEFKGEIKGECIDIDKIPVYI